MTTRQHTRQVYNENKGETANSRAETDFFETVEVKKTAKPMKEETSICGPHIQILLAVLVFLVFTAFLVYYLMEEMPHHEITGSNVNPVSEA